MLLALIGGLLLAGGLLREDDVADLQQGVELAAGFVDHVVHFDEAGECLEGGSRACGLVEAVAVSAGEVDHDTAGLRDLGDG